MACVATKSECLRRTYSVHTNIQIIIIHSFQAAVRVKGLGIVHRIRTYLLTSFYDTLLHQQPCVVHCPVLYIPHQFVLSLVSCHHRWKCYVLSPAFGIVSSKYHAISIFRGTYLGFAYAASYWAVVLQSPLYGTFDPPMNCIILALEPQKFSRRLNASWFCQLRCFMGIGVVYSIEVRGT